MNVMTVAITVHLMLPVQMKWAATHVIAMKASVAMVQFVKVGNILGLIWTDY